MTERTGAKGRTFYQYDLQGNLIEECGSERGRYYYNPFNQQTKAERSMGIFKRIFMMEKACGQELTTGRAVPGLCSTMANC